MSGTQLTKLGSMSTAFRCLSMSLHITINQGCRERFCAGHKEPQACGLMCHASWSRHGHQDRHPPCQESQRRRHGVLAGTADMPAPSFVPGHADKSQPFHPRSRTVELQCLGPIHQAISWLCSCRSTTLLIARSAIKVESVTCKTRQCSMAVTGGVSSK